MLIKEGITPYRTEWSIGAPDLSLGGTVDFAGRAQDGTLVLVDWKGTSRMETYKGLTFKKSRWVGLYDSVLVSVFCMSWGEEGYSLLPLSLWSLTSVPAPLLCLQTAPGPPL